MRRITVLAAAGAISVAVGAISFTVARTSASPPIPERAQPQNQAAAPVAVGAPARSSAFPTPGRANLAAPSPACENAYALGVSRVVEIDTTGGPAFGFEHFKQYDFLRDKEVVLTFDDGPWPGNTNAVLNALADECLRAIFFEIGKHATWHPEITKQVLEAGMTVALPALF